MSKRVLRFLQGMPKALLNQRRNSQKLGTRHMPYKLCVLAFSAKKTMEWKQIRSQFIISYHRLQKRKICIPNNWYATCVINDYTHDLLMTKLLYYNSTTKCNEIMIWENHLFGISATEIMIVRRYFKPAVFFPIHLVLQNYYFHFQKSSNSFHFLFKTKYILNHVLVNTRPLYKIVTHT